MAFVEDARGIAFKAMQEINPLLSAQYVAVIDFLSEYPDAASALRGKHAPDIGSINYIYKQAHAFADARQPRAPQAPATIPDEMVSVILVSYFGIKPANVEKIKREHALSMGAENLVGDLLERYLASVMEVHGWIWCSGAMVKAVDFIKPPQQACDSWWLLQVKNRDNSENSSSSAIRIGTDIKKWHRSFSKKPELNWEAFPDESLRRSLSETGFKDFVRNYLQGIKQVAPTLSIPQR